MFGVCHYPSSDTVQNSSALAFVLECETKFVLSHLKIKEIPERKRCYVPLLTHQATKNFSGTVQLRDTVEGFTAAWRHRHRGHLPLLRRRLRAAHLQQGRRTHRHRGRS